ncbi:MAG: hypothetical protein QXR63_06055 [Candidatus Bathyarchaeia archaeon]
MGFKPFPYQAELLRCQSKRIVGCWTRQTGKTTAITVKVIHSAFTNADAATLFPDNNVEDIVDYVDCLFEGILIN